MLWLEEAASGARRRLLAEADLPAFGEGKAAVKPRLAGYRWAPKGDARTALGRGRSLPRDRPGQPGAAAHRDPLRGGTRRVLARRTLGVVRSRQRPVGDRAGERQGRSASPRPAPRTISTASSTGSTRRNWRGARRSRYVWSPDSRWIASLSLDETRVPKYPIVDRLETHPTTTEQRYPQPGDPNPVVGLSVIPVDAAPGVRARRDHVWAGGNAEYVPRFGWTPDSSAVWYELLDRPQTRLELVREDVATGKVATLLVEKDAAWINLHDDQHFFRDGRLLWSSEAGGYRHLIVYGADGAPRAVTSGSWEVASVAAVDEPGGWIYFTADEAGPLEDQLYRVRPDGSGFARLTAERRHPPRRGRPGGQAPPRHLLGHCARPGDAGARRRGSAASHRGRRAAAVARRRRARDDRVSDCRRARRHGAPRISAQARGVRPGEKVPRRRVRLRRAARPGRPQRVGQADGAVSPRPGGPRLPGVLSRQPRLGGEGPRLRARVARPVRQGRARGPARWGRVPEDAAVHRCVPDRDLGVVVRRVHDLLRAHQRARVSSRPAPRWPR